MLDAWLRLLQGTTVVLLLPLVLVLGCSSVDSEGTEKNSSDDGSAQKSEDGEDDQGEGDQRVPVEVVEIGRGRIEELLRFSTNLEAEEEVQVFSQAARLVTGLYVEEGDDIRKGQVLVRLQDDEQRTQVARVESQLGKAGREYERQQNLFEQKLISEQVFNEATYDLEQLQLTLRDARRELGYTEVRAPISGTVTQRLVSIGDQITMNQHLFDIVDFNSIVARVYVPEKVLARLAKGQTAHLFSDAFVGEPRSGEIQRIAPLVDARSGTVKVTVSVPRNAELLPGMYVSVELITAVHEEAVLIPKRALVYDDEQVFVFRVRELSAEEVAAALAEAEKENEDEEESDGQQAAEAESDEPVLAVERLLVGVLLEDRANIEPVDGIEPGDRIVVAGQAGLKDEARVRLVGDES
ncbi:MAG: efflux RND transporter periplasmic adaptor subunit [Acidobacteria bacterium]|nr:efflux RND transporter periplasmic adaptor subunit [Acidobacteriota bacterium]